MWQLLDAGRILFPDINRPTLTTLANSRTTMLALLAIVSISGLFGQSGPEPLSFDIVSVKPNLINDPNDPRYNGESDYIPHRSGDRITMRNSDLISVISWAYSLTNNNYQLVAGQREKILWKSYDIEARAPGVRADDDLRRMFQTLLEDRFHLKVHRETRELPAYDLVMTRRGSKLTPAQPGPKHSTGFGGSSSWVTIGNDGNHLVGEGASMEELAIVLSGKMRTPVRDRTGITGAFNFNVVFSSGMDASSAPMLSTAIHELGLSLEKSKGSFEVVVIDRVEEPSPN